MKSFSAFMLTYVCTYVHTYVSLFPCRNLADPSPLYPQILQFSFLSTEPSRFMPADVARSLAIWSNLLLLLLTHCPLLHRPSSTLQGRDFLAAGSKEASISGLLVMDLVCVPFRSKSCHTTSPNLNSYKYVPLCRI